MFYVYFAKSLKNEKVYVGKTSKEPAIRVREHNVGSNQWSKNNGPFQLLYFEKYNCKVDVEERERFYKSGFGRKIKKLIIKELDSS
ncbi:MAG: GIY-YIG nuclease family protein [Candidatus Omnitrophota bacterium]|nr:GIY-YIG nuclease family protein [Candidatus Omnitrophota bacterium]